MSSLYGETHWSQAIQVRKDDPKDAARALVQALHDDQSPLETQEVAVVVQPSSPAETTAVARSEDDAPRLADFDLLLAADVLDDLERTRIANENRVRAVVQMGGDPSPALLGIVDALKTLEHGAELELKRTLRRHPLGQWVKQTAGVGEKQGARLLAAIGDPATRRTVSQLWAYCGYHVLHPGRSLRDTQGASAGVDSSGSDHERTDSQVEGVGADHPGQGISAAHSSSAGVAPRRQRGQRANWNGTAKMRAFLCAESAVKTGVRKLPACDDTNGYDLAGRKPISPLGATYLKRRAHTAVTHPEWTDGHSHNDGLRIVAKAILRDLWVEARAIEKAA